MKEQQMNIYLAKLGNTKEQFIKDEDYATRLLDFPKNPYL